MGVKSPLFLVQHPPILPKLQDFPRPKRWGPSGDSGLCEFIPGSPALDSSLKGMGWDDRKISGGFEKMIWIWIICFCFVSWGGRFSLDMIRMFEDFVFSKVDQNLWIFMSSDNHEHFCFAGPFVVSGIKKDFDWFYPDQTRIPKTAKKWSGKKTAPVVFKWNTGMIFSVFKKKFTTDGGWTQARCTPGYATAKCQWPRGLIWKSCMVILGNFWIGISWLVPSIGIAWWVDTFNWYLVWDCQFGSFCLRFFHVLLPGFLVICFCYSLIRFTSRCQFFFCNFLNGTTHDWKRMGMMKSSLNIRVYHRSLNIDLACKSF